MKFESKAHMAQELLAGKQFSDRNGGIIHFDNSSVYEPFRYDGDKMYGAWSRWMEDMWTEVKPHHTHQDLIQAFNSGAEIEYFEDSINRWLPEMSPTWSENVKYRVKPKTKTVYEWMYLAHGNTWILDHGLETESDASKRWKGTPHQKTGRSFEVPA
jgi:hypothetical protein